MSINGNLKTMELSELLQWLSQGTKTGTLVIQRGQVEKRIVFRRGAIIATASSDPKEYLGHFLVSHGFIDETVLAKAMEMQEANKMMLGKILVTIGAISAPDLDRMLRLKAEETIYDVFTWPEGDFHFVDDEVPSFPMVPLSLNVTAVVLEGAQRADDWQRIRERIPNNQVVPVSVGELSADDEDALAQRIFALVDDDRTIEEIALHCHSSEFQVCRALYAPILDGQVKIVRPRTLPAPAEAPEGGVEPGSLLDSARQHLEAGEFELAMRHLRAAQSLEPESQRIRREIGTAETLIGKALAKAGVIPTSVPRLERSFTELTELDISPQEGFILTRINDSYDIQTILKISPMPPLDAQLVFWRLLQAGHISLSAGRKT